MNVSEEQLRSVTSIRGEAVTVKKVVKTKKRNYVIFKYRDGRTTEIDFKEEK